MNLLKQAKEIIKTLISKRFYAECPCCQEPVLLKNAGLFYLDDFSQKGKSLYQEHLEEIEERKRQLKERPKKIAVKSETGARAVNIGYILERIAPSLKAFQFNRNDCRSIFDPIDYIIFENLSNKGRVSRIIFTEIKTGQARLTYRQNEIKQLVEKKKISFKTYRV